MPRLFYPDRNSKLIQNCWETIRVSRELLAQTAPLVRRLQLGSAKTNDTDSPADRDRSRDVRAS
jgi:hypothetical protein